MLIANGHAAKHWLRSFIIVLPGFSSLPTAAEPALVTVVEATVSRIVDELPLTGTVTSKRHAALSPRVSGLVSAVHFDAGDHVHKGEVLLKLDSVLAELQLRRAEAAVAEAQARLVEGERLRDEAFRLVRDHTIPETQVLAAQAEVRVRAAALSRLEAERNQQAETVRRHALVAPFAGVISRKLTEAGEWVETGTPVLELVSVDDLRLDVEAPQEQFHDIEIGIPVTIRLDALPGRVFDGQVAAKVPVKDPAARTFLVRVEVDDPDGLMTPGMSAEAEFRIHTGRQGVIVPRDALVSQPDGSVSVWVVTDNDGRLTVSQRQVKLGRTPSEGVEILKGLAAGQTVVVRGNEILTEGQPVRVLQDSS